VSSCNCQKVRDRLYTTCAGDSGVMHWTPQFVPQMNPVGPICGDAAKCEMLLHDVECTPETCRSSNCQNMGFW
jgi:hypothetical protein